MRFWRICRRRYAAESASGEGARLYGGRWNSRGVRVVYTSTSLALAAIETFVNLEPNLRPNDLVYVEGEVPDGVEILKVALESLPAKWNRSREESLRKIGDAWVREGLTLGLLVPSSAIKGEWNLLLSPAHKDFAKIVFQQPQAFEFDVRMFR
jgi:RES domain-containing protein